MSRGVSEVECLSRSAARVPMKRDLSCRFVRELAEYEKLLHEVEATEADIDAALFGSYPRLFCEIAEWDGEPAGFAVWFINFSTFSGRSGIYLEDLFVRPAQRGKGIGKALLAHLARAVRGERLVAVAMGGAGLEYAVDRILQIARRSPDGRVDGVPGQRSGADARWRRGRADGGRSHRRGRRERRDRRRRRHAVAAEIRHGSASRR